MQIKELVPEPILTYTINFKMQTLPTGILENLNGDIFVLDKPKCVIHVINRPDVAENNTFFKLKYDLHLAPSIVTKIKLSSGGVVSVFDAHGTDDCFGVFLTQKASVEKCLARYSQAICFRSMWCPQKRGRK